MNKPKRTRYPELGYRCDGRSLWRLYDLTDAGAYGEGRAIGPHYASRDELLADLPRYAREFGCEA